MSMLYAAFGAFGMFLFFALAFFIIFSFVQIRKSTYNIDVKVTTITQGKEAIDLVRAKKTTLPEIGECYEVDSPSFRRQRRHIIPYFGEEYTLPEIGKRRWYLAVTYDNGAYAPEYFVGKEEVSVVNGIDDEGKPIYKKVTRHIVKPVKTSLRLVYLQISGYHQKEYGEKKGWWERNGATVISIGLVIASMVVSVIMLILGYNAFQEFMASEAPPWLNRLISAMASNNQPPG